jgi:hypothetical protein
MFVALCEFQVKPGLKKVGLICGPQELGRAAFQITAASTLMIGGKFPASNCHSQPSSRVP